MAKKKQGYTIRLLNSRRRLHQQSTPTPWHNIHYSVSEIQPNTKPVGNSSNRSSPKRLSEASRGCSCPRFGNNLHATRNMPTPERCSTSGTQPAACLLKRWTSFYSWAASTLLSIVILNTLCCRFSTARAILYTSSGTFRGSPGLLLVCPFAFSKKFGLISVP